MCAREEGTTWKKERIFFWVFCFLIRGRRGTKRKQIHEFKSCGHEWIMKKWVGYEDRLQTRQHGQSIAVAVTGNWLDQWRSHPLPGDYFLFGEHPTPPIILVLGRGELKSRKKQNKNRPLGFLGGNLCGAKRRLGLNAKQVEVDPCEKLTFFLAKISLFRFFYEEVSRLRQNRLFSCVGRDKRRKLWGDTTTQN